MLIISADWNADGNKVGSFVFMQKVMNTCNGGFKILQVVGKHFLVGLWASRVCWEEQGVLTFDPPILLLRHQIFLLISASHERLIHRFSLIKKLNDIIGALAPFFAETHFCTVFARPKKQKKTFTVFRRRKRTKISDYDFFIRILNKISDL